MELEVMIPSPAVDFNFDSACTSPYISAPTSPQRFGNLFFSAPTSPTRASSFFRDLNAFSTPSADGDATVSGGSIPFSWEEKPGTPKINDDNDFEFDFSGHLERTSLSADELFDGGKIKPLKPPPGLVDSPRSPIFSMSPRRRKSDFDPFAAAIERTRLENTTTTTTTSTNSRERRRDRTRSLSPFRVCDIFETEINRNTSNSTKSKASSSRGYRKWKLRDLLLFRSASEGRETSPLKKYSLLKKTTSNTTTTTEDVKNSSFRSTDSAGSVSRRRGTVSAHELHYTANRAVSEEMKKKTFLPYKHGLLGCLGFNPAVQEISRGLGSMTRG